MATMMDPQGRTVWLTKRGWAHVLEEHQEVERHLPGLKKCVEKAEKRTRGKFADTEKLWLRNVGPAKCVCSRSTLRRTHRHHPDRLRGREGPTTGRLDLTTRIGEWEFDHSKYDSEADVLYLSIGGPREGYGEESPEGHILRFDEHGAFYGVTIIDAQRLMQTDGHIVVTLPKREQIELPEEQFEYA